MKHLLTALLLFLGVAKQSYAQLYTYYMDIPDNSIILSVNKTGTTVTPIFSNPAINDIVDDYVVTHFCKAFPTSHYEYLQHVYKIQVNSTALLPALRAYDSTLFPRYDLIDTVAYSSFTPGDWNGPGPGYDMGYLDFIGARDAWDISQGGTHGDPNVIIGVCDNYFDLNNPDLYGKIAYNGGNQMAIGPAADHGTGVAGYIAAATDTNGGVPAIGFNCRLDIETNGNGLIGDSVMLSLSQRNRKVINASWYNPGYNAMTYPTSSFKHFILQGLYNEIYERGTFTVVAAGQQTGDTREYTFPASFDHNFSVTHLGWLNDTTGNGVHDAKYVHERYAGDSSQFANHNDRVDLCAPGLDLSGLTYDPADANKHWYIKLATGTSYSAPLVAGTAGLMLSLEPNLSPYQMEYILKETSMKNIYNVSWNKKYRGTTPYNGRIGTGLLKAKAALDYINDDDFSLNDPATATFVIKGINLNTKCVPALVKKLPKPKIDVVLENGTPPYSYKWEEISGNSCFIGPMSGSGVNSISATVASGSAPFLVYYRLTVYDASPIQKVASTVVKIQLINDSTKWDLAMRDAYADLLDERNGMDKLNVNNWNVWESPDLWNRHLNDSLPTHENPEYFNSAPNYLYTRIKNVGCRVSPGNDSVRLNLYWTVASTGETWNVDWTGGSTVPPSGQPGGGIIGANMSLPAVDPSTEILVERLWSPPQPQLYDTSWKELPVCVLARITEPGASNDGMTFAEDTVTKQNVWNNNNIVTRNLVVMNYNTANKTTSTSPVIVGNSSSTPTVFAVQVITGQQLQPHLHGHLGNNLTATLALGDLYDVWVDGGRKGNVTSYDDDAKTVSYDLHQPLRLDGLLLGAYERHVILFKLQLIGDNIPYAINDERIFIRQLIEHEVEVDNGDGTSFSVNRDEVYGAVGFAINIEANVDGGEEKRNIEALDETPAFVGYPNPTNNNFTLQAKGNEKSLSAVTIIDITGRTVFTRKNILLTNSVYKINTKALQPGIYVVKIIDEKGQHHSVKFMKSE